MGLTVKQPENAGNFEPLKPGTYHAVCYAVIDLGTQYSEYYGKATPKLQIIWELPNERIDLVREGKTVNLPRAISKRYTQSLHEKSALSHDLVSWRGRKFTPEELAGFNMRNILGANCLLNITHTQKDNKTYTEVAAVSPLMTGMKKVAAENPTIAYDMETDGYDIPAAVPEWIRDVIKKSEEWRQQSIGESGDTGVAVEDEDIPVPDDDIPF